MKIIYISNARMPTERAHGIQIMHMCAALAAEGADVTLLVPRRHNEIRDDIFAYYGMQSTFHVVWLPCVDVLWWRHLEPFFYFLELATFLFFVRLYIFTHRTDMVFSRELFLSLCTRRVIYEAHTVAEQPSRIERWLLCRARAVIAISRGLADDIAARGVSRSHLHVLPDGVSLPQFERPANFDRAATRVQLFGAHASRIVIVYAGSYFLHPWKGVDTLLDAASQLDDSFIFYLVGGCPEEIEEGEQKLAARCIRNVVLIPRIAHPQVAAYIQAADMVVLPNSARYHMSAAHTSPLKLFEYMAAGTPILASDLPSTREIISDATAILVKPDDGIAWADAILYATSNRDECARRAVAAHAAAQAYDWRARARALMRLAA